MTGSEIIFYYFPFLNDTQKRQFDALFDLYSEWNKKINLISRKDIEYLYERHVLHSLAIAKIIQFSEDSHIMDLGTGGGFPGIPLAIFFPGTQFTLVDSTAKKIRAAKEIASSIGLLNTTAISLRAEDSIKTYDFVVSRGTATLNDLVKWTKGKYKKDHHHDFKNGLICLKGGNLADELIFYNNKAKIFEIKNFFKEEFFKEKKVVCLEI